MKPGREKDQRIGSFFGNQLRTPNPFYSKVIPSYRFLVI